MANEDQHVPKLGVTPADPKNPLPLHYQVFADLKGVIQSGRVKAGDLLPPEVELARAYGVGRQTVRAAIARLVNEKLLERFAGIGTFVCAPADRTHFYLDRSFTRQMAELGLRARSQVLRQQCGVIDEHAPAELQARLGSSCLILERLRFGDDTPVGLQYTTVVMEACPGLEEYDFSEHSLYELLSNEYHLPIVRIRHVVSAVLANKEHSQLLQTPVGAPLLLVRSTAYLEGGEPIENSASVYRVDRYVFSTTDQFEECG